MRPPTRSCSLRGHARTNGERTDRAASLLLSPRGHIGKPPGRERRRRHVGREAGLAAGAFAASRSVGPKPVGPPGAGRGDYFAGSSTARYVQRQSSCSQSSWGSGGSSRASSIGCTVPCASRQGPQLLRGGGATIITPVTAGRFLQCFRLFGRESMGSTSSATKGRTAKARARITRGRGARPNASGRPPTLATIRPGAGTDRAAAAGRKHRRAASVVRAPAGAGSGSSRGAPRPLLGRGNRRGGKHRHRPRRGDPPGGL